MDIVRIVCAAVGVALCVLLVVRRRRRIPE